MKDPKHLFHLISYVQYPFMLAGLFFAYHPIFTDFINTWSDLNKAMVLFGVGIGFASFQDIARPQNKWSKKVFESPKYSRIFTIIISGQTIFFLLAGVVGVFMSTEAIISEFSYGLLSVGLGMLGVLKSVIEMAEYHQNKMKENLAANP